MSKAKENQELAIFSAKATEIIKTVGGTKAAREYDGKAVQGLKADQIRELAIARTQAQKQANERSKANNNGIASSDLLKGIMCKPNEYLARLKAEGYKDLADSLKATEKTAKKYCDAVSELAQLKELIAPLQVTVDECEKELLPVATQVRDALGERLAAEKRLEALKEDVEKAEKVREATIKNLKLLGMTRDQAEAMVPKV